MTIVVGISNLLQAVVIADSRLTHPGDGVADVYRDVCQKLFSPNPWSILGFSGHLCLARDLTAETFRRLQQDISPDWLRSNNAIRDHFRFHSRQHARNHRRVNVPGVETEAAQLLIIWMDHSRSVLGGQSPSDERWYPGVEMIKIQMPQVVITRTKFGIEVIGSGSKIAQALNDEFLPIANAGSRNVGYISSIIISKLLEENPVSSVGGLHQIAVLTSRGVAWVPYFSWVEVAPDCGTYVAMRIENGYWVQEHRPTATKVRIASPFEIAAFARDVRGLQSEIFDPRRFTCETPGVVSSRNPREVFHVYDPDSFADDPFAEQIREAWGDEPLTPMSY